MGRSVPASVRDVLARFAARVRLEHGDCQERPLVMAIEQEGAPL